MKNTITNAYGQVVDVYADTAQGAKEALVDMSIYSMDDLDHAVPDPHVSGVWKITLTKKAFREHGVTASVVHLAGYANPWGDMRQINDFEDIWG